MISINHEAGFQDGGDDGGDGYDVTVMNIMSRELRNMVTGGHQIAQGPVRSDHGKSTSLVTRLSIVNEAHLVVIAQGTWLIFLGDTLAQGLGDPLGEKWP